MGNMPAQATANSVMASAKRLMELRHRWFNSSRMAEIKVPAWPMPIHHTKLVMANPHITGVRMPQIPVPLTNSTPTASRNNSISERPIPKLINQKTGVRFVSTTVAIWSVTVPKVYPGAMIVFDPECGSFRSSTNSALSFSATALDLQLRIGIPQRGQVRGSRPGVEVRQQTVIPLFRFHFRNAAIGVVDIAENNRFRGATRSEERRVGKECRS